MSSPERRGRREAFPQRREQRLRNAIIHYMHEALGAAVSAAAGIWRGHAWWTEHLCREPVAEAQLLRQPGRFSLLTSLCEQERKIITRNVGPITLLPEESVINSSEPSRDFCNAIV